MKRSEIEQKEFNIKEIKLISQACYVRKHDIEFWWKFQCGTYYRTMQSFVPIEKVENSRYWVSIYSEGLMK